MPRTKTHPLTTSVTGVTNETVDNSGNEASQSAGAGATATTLQLRGFAMVLIAVAVMFGLWALYAFTQDDSSEQAAEQTNDSSEQEPGTVGADTAEQSTDIPGDEAGDAQADADKDNPQAKSEQDDADRADAEKAKGASTGDDAPAAAPAAPAAPLKVNVLNNSMTKGLAADVADRLRADGRELGEVGNFADEILPETTVFFPKGNAAAEQTARELADQYHGVAREHSNILPDNTRDGVTIVLTDN